MVSLSLGQDMQALRGKPLQRASDMKKAVLVLATAATIGITALVTPSPAADQSLSVRRGGWGWGAGPTPGIPVGTVVGGILVGVPAYGPGYCYYLGPGAYHGPWCYEGYHYGR